MEELESVKKALEDEKSSIYTQVHVLQEELVSPLYCTYMLDVTGCCLYCIVCFMICCAKYTTRTP